MRVRSLSFGVDVDIRNAKSLSHNVHITLTSFVDERHILSRKNDTNVLMVKILRFCVNGNVFPWLKTYLIV